MKAVGIVLKAIAAVSAFLSLLAFGSDLLPVDGVSFGDYMSADGGYYFYKVVPVEGVDTVQVGILLLLASIGLFILAKVISRRCC